MTCPGCGWQRVPRRAAKRRSTTCANTSQHLVRSGSRALGPLDLGRVPGIAHPRPRLDRPGAGGPPNRSAPVSDRHRSAGSGVRFTEVQRFSQPLLLLLVAVVALPFWYLAVRHFLFGWSPAERPGGNFGDSPGLAGAWVVAGVLVPALILGSKLTTEVNDAAPRIRFWPFHRPDGLRRDQPGRGGDVPPARLVRRLGHPVGRAGEHGLQRVGQARSEARPHEREDRGRGLADGSRVGCFLDPERGRHGSADDGAQGRSDVQAGPWGFVCGAQRVVGLSNTWRRRR